VTIIEPTDGAQLRFMSEAEGTVAVRATVIDVSISKVQFYVDDNFRDEMTEPFEGDEYKFKWDTYWNETDGPHTLSISALDKAGNVNRVDFDVTLNNSYPPMVGITSPQPGQIFNCYRETQTSCIVNVDVNSADDEGLAYVEALLPPGIKSIREHAPYKFDWQASKVPDGPYTIVVKAVDNTSLWSETSVSVCINTCVPQGGEGREDRGEIALGGDPASAVGMDPLTGESESETSMEGVTGTADLRDVLKYAWTTRDVDVKDDEEPWTGWVTVGNDQIVAVEISQYIMNLTEDEQGASLLAPNFTAYDFANHAKWRIIVRDWVSGVQGKLENMVLSIAERTDPLVADTDGDGLKDGEEIIVQDLDGDGLKEPNEIVEIKSLPVAVDTEGDGLDDYAELVTYGTNPFLVDSDGDDLSDLDEVEQYYFNEAIAMDATLEQSGLTGVSYSLPAPGYYMYKFIVDVTIRRQTQPWDLPNELNWLGPQDDALIEGRLVMRKDGEIVPSASRGEVISTRLDLPFITIEETRFVCSLRTDVMDGAGQHTASLELKEGSVGQEVTMHIKRFEVHRRSTNPAIRDTDGDGLGDGDEAKWNSKAWEPDSDMDGLLDGWNDANRDGVWQPGETIGEVGDSEQDGAGGWGTDPTDVDSDGDGLCDGHGIQMCRGELDFGALPSSNDTDGDSLLDGWDDRDGDRLWDNGEAFGEVGDVRGSGAFRTNPVLMDTDNDLVNDDWELKEGYNPLNYYDAFDDPDNDGYFTQMEFLIDTDPHNADTDGDNAEDGIEVQSQDILMRTSVENGALSSENYGFPSDWVAYNPPPPEDGGVRYGYVYSVTNESVAESPANSDDPANMFLTALDDGARFYHNTLYNCIFLWLPGADHDDSDFNGTGDGILEGTYHRFDYLPESLELLESPQPGYWHREIYRGSDPRDNDTDEDGLEDGDEKWWYLDFDGDDRINADDPDSDSDGIWDGDEIDWGGNPDGDYRENMVDPDSDSYNDDGTPDGLEPLWNQDVDGDGLANMVDPDNDGDNLLDKFEDLDHDGILDSGESDMNLPDTDGDGLWDGWEDKNGDGVFQEWLEVGEDVDADGVKDLLETDPAMVDTDDDGMPDSEERRLGDYWLEAEDYEGQGVQQHFTYMAVGNFATYQDSAPQGKLYEQTKILSATTTRYKLFVRASTYTYGQDGIMYVKRLDSGQLESFSVDVFGEYSWYSSPALESELADSVTLAVYDGGSGGSPTFYLDRLVLARMDSYHVGQACGASSSITLNYTDAAGGTGVFCYEVPASVHQTGLKLKLENAQGASVDVVASMNVARARHGTAQGNGRVYVFGGRDDQGTMLSHLESYDQASDTWELLSVPSGRERDGLAMAVSHGILVITGGYSHGYEVLKYDPSTETFEPMQYDLIDEALEHAAVELNGRVYIIGGVSNSHEEVDIRRVPMSVDDVIPSLTQTRRYLAAVALDGYIYAFGGLYDTTVYGDVWRCKPGDAYWTWMGQMNTPRWGHAAAVVEGKIWVFGGRGTYYGSELSSVELYDPDANTWTFAAQPLPYARAFLGAAEVNGTVFLTAGFDSQAHVTSTTQVNAVSLPSHVTVDSGGDGSVEWTWPRTAPSDTTEIEFSGAVAAYSRRNHGADTGKLMIFGGMDQNSNTVSSTNSVYPGILEWSSLQQLMSLSRSAAAVWGGRLYVGGGLFQDGSMNGLIYSFDLVEKEWSPYMALQPSARHSFTLSAVEGELYAIGGAEFDITRPWAYALNIRTQEWRQLADMPYPVQDHAALVMGDDIYIMGGRQVQGSSVTYLDIVQIYHTHDDTWTMGPRLWEARAGLKAAENEGAVFVFGGQRSNQGTPEEAYSPKIQVLYPGSSDWINLTDMPTPKAYFSATSVGGKLYAFGGTNKVGANGDVLGEITCYDVWTDSWTVVGQMANPVSHAADALAGNLIPVLIRVSSGSAGTIKVTVDERFAIPIFSDPSQQDSNLDGINDGDALLTYMAQALLFDTDSDNLRDASEIGWGTRPDLQDTDGDGLWDGYEDLNGNGAYDPQLERGEHIGSGAPNNPGETNPLDPDTDDDGLFDGEELGLGVQWFEAEYNYQSCSGGKYDDDGDGVEETATCISILAYAKATATYRFSVLARDGAPSTRLNIRLDLSVGGGAFSNKYFPLYYETAGGVLQSRYRWFSTDYFQANAGDTLDFRVYSLNPPLLRIDRAVLAKASNVVISQLTLGDGNPCENGQGDCVVDFTGDVGTSLVKTVYAKIPALNDGVPRYVTRAQFDVDVVGSRGLPIRAIIGGRSLCFNPDWDNMPGYPSGAWIDYAGEFNKFLTRSRWDGSSDIKVPISFIAFSNCFDPGIEDDVTSITVTAVNIVLEPFASSPISKDNDREGLQDFEEWLNGTSPMLANSDLDQRSIQVHWDPDVFELWDCTDYREVYPGDTTCEPEPKTDKGTDPTSMDTEADALPDGPDSDPWSADGDGDGILDGAESVIGTDSTNPDTDADGLLDGRNITQTMGSQYYSDWETRGIKFVQVDTTTRRYLGESGWTTDPLSPDTDGDWLKDGYEVGDVYTCPLKRDSDGDGMPDGWEVKFNGKRGVTLNPNAPGDAGDDHDEDGLSNLDEYIMGTSWCAARGISEIACTYDVNGDEDDDDFILNYVDDDDDGIDTKEELFYGSDPYVNDITTDLDGDGISNWDEYIANPRLDYSEPDTDGDGLEDGAEKSFWEAYSPPPSCMLDGWATCVTTYDVDGDGISDGDEVDGWYIWVLVDREAGEWAEIHVDSDPALVNSDSDSLPDDVEYLKSDPRSADTDGDGLADWLTSNPSSEKPGPGQDNNPVEPEDIPPEMSDIVQNARLEWSGIFVVHTWLDLEITTRDNSGVAAVEFVFKDSGATHDGFFRGNERYSTTFEIDFWGDYMWGYEVEVGSYDLAGNVMKKTAGGGLTYLIGKLVAGFLSFLLGPAIGGAVFGFFLGMLVGLFEDLSIFLHIHEIFGAITQLPKLIGDLVGNPSMLMAMFVDMITAHLTRCMLVNPFGTPSGTPDEWAGWVAKRFFGEEPGGTNVLVFGVACTVGSIVGYLVQQFIIGTGIGKVLGKLKDSGKFAELAGKLGIQTKALKKTTTATQKAAKATEKGLMRGTAEAATEALEKAGVKASDDAAGGFARTAARLGCSGACEAFVGKFASRYGDDFTERVLKAKSKLPDGKAKQLEGLMKRANNPIKRFADGAKAEIDRVLHHIDVNDLDEIQPSFWHDGLGKWFRPDGKLTGNRFLEVKKWSVDYLRRNMNALVNKMKIYRDGFSNGGVLEIIGNFPSDVIDLLESKLPGNVHLDVLPA
jgi:N-acetylneuraminic acid mutarotase